jgi:hypothetical protein
MRSGPNSGSDFVTSISPTIGITEAALAFTSVDR